MRDGLHESPVRLLRPRRGKPRRREEEFDPGYIAEIERQARFILSLLSPYVGANPKLLDFGCGNGAFAAAAVTQGWDAYGFDLNVDAMAHANRLWKTDRFSSARDYTSTHAGFFDVAVSLQVFEHLRDPVGVGTDMLRMVKPGGIILIDVPNVHQLGERRAIGSTLDPTAHLCHFSLTTLTRLVRQLGCDVIYTSAAPSLYRAWERLPVGHLALPLAKLTKRLLPGIGTGVCVIGRKR